MHKELAEEITAWVDGELNDKIRTAELSELINKNHNLAFEKFVQTKIKLLCSKKTLIRKTPEDLANSIKNKLQQL